MSVGAAVSGWTPWPVGFRDASLQSPGATRSAESMTSIVSLVGILGRFAGDLMMSALGWASSLLFGRVPRAHERFLVLMMAASFAWLVALAGLLVPSVVSWLLSSTPHPPFLNLAWLAGALLGAVVLLPALVGLAGTLVPADGRRPEGVGFVREIGRGYVLAPLISGLLIFLAAVGLVRKIRSVRHRWVDVHIPIVMAAGAYEETASILAEALNASGVEVVIRDAPRVLTIPAWLLTHAAGPNVGKLRPGRVVALCAPDLRIGLYPSDIAISCPAEKRTRLRAALLTALLSAAAHLTTSAEAQAIEDRLRELSRTVQRAGIAQQLEVRRELAVIDAEMLDLAVSSDEWDTLNRLRLQAERDEFMRLAGQVVDVPAVGHRSSIRTDAPDGPPRTLPGARVSRDLRSERVR